MTREEARAKLEQARELMQAVHDEYVDEFGELNLDTRDRFDVPDDFETPVAMCLTHAIKDLDEPIKLLGADTKGGYMACILEYIMDDMLKDLRNKAKKKQLRAED